MFLFVIVPSLNTKDLQATEKDQLSQEGQLLDKKSLLAVTGKTASRNTLATDCIAITSASKDRLPPELIQSPDHTHATHYFIFPGLMCGQSLAGVTTLKRIVWRHPAEVIQEQYWAMHAPLPKRTPPGHIYEPH